jgi:hypothetical protein
MLSRLYTLLLVLIIAALSPVVFDLLIEEATRGVRCELFDPLRPGGVFAGIFAFLAVTGTAVAVYRFPSAFPTCVVILLVFLGGMALSSPVRSIAWQKPRWDRCAGNLSKIAVALAQYRADHGSYPPACVTDKDGKPMHSWRVLILPYLNDKELYDRYNFCESWNSPKNAEIVKDCPKEFCSPFFYQTDSKFQTETSCVAVTGQDTAWNENIAADSSACTGRLILLVEVLNSGICWMEPRDFDRAHMAGKIGNLSTIGYNSRWTLLVACADGSVWKLPKDFPETALLKSLAVGAADKADWDRSGAKLVNLNDPMWGRLITGIAFPVWFLFVTFLLYRARRSGIGRISAPSGGC